MPKLVLYSAQDTPEDHAVNLELMRLIAKPEPHIAWIPSDFRSGSHWFHAKVAYYARYDAVLEETVRFDINSTAADLERLWTFDAIHLSGGNTVEFLRSLRQHQMLEPLRMFVQKSGVLIGVSAGAILMTPSIETTFAGESGDLRAETGFDQAALGLVDFAFVPHYSDDLETTCRELASTLRQTVYACRDGDGIVVNEGVVRLVGAVLQFNPALNGA